MTLAVVVVYLVILLVIGAVSSRRGSASAEDYFLAGRSFGSFILFMALFGTNVTAFALLGLPGRSYHVGVGVFGFFGATAAFWGSALFVLLGYPIWKTGKQYGFLTPTQMFAARWQSSGVGYLLLALLLLYTVPYIVIGIMGGGLAIAELSDGQLPYAPAALLITVVTVTYTSLGGMRGTAWTNVFQASVFLIFLTFAAIAIARENGGATALFQRLLETEPKLLERNFPAGIWATSFLVGPVSVIAFPHMFMRLLAARDPSALRRTALVYPIALMFLFVPVTLIGVWGAVVHPGLVGPESDRILPLLVADALPEAFAAIGLAAILAAVMSSLDGQLLTISTLLSVDVFHHGDETSARHYGRIAVVAVAAVAFAIALARPEAIFQISKYAFSGYTLIVPVIVAAFFVPRSTGRAVIIASVTAHLLLAAYYVPREWLPLPELPTFGVLPVAICLSVEIVLLVVVSRWTPPSRTRFDDPFGRPGAGPAP
ncbi:MAG: sodium:solute symporter family protein [Planctomycetes bacterium]|nr:sodium:solute symporter family protein [Planctomycetota bacterium]